MVAAPDPALVGQTSVTTNDPVDGRLANAKAGAVLLVSQAASSLLNFIPSAIVILTLEDRDVATMAVAITGYTLALGVGRSLFGEAIIVLSRREGDQWAHVAATTIRIVLAVTSAALLASTLVAGSVLSEDLTSWILAAAVSFGMMSHDLRRYELIARRRERQVLVRDLGLVSGTVTALVITWMAFEPSINRYLWAWGLVAIVASADLFARSKNVDVRAAHQTIRAGRTFGFGTLANRAGILVVAIIAREIAGDASLADAEAQRLTMAVVNMAILGAGPISLMGLSGRRTILRDSTMVSASLVTVAALWWAAVSVGAATFANTLPAVFEPWQSGTQWNVLVWYVAVAIPYGFQYRLRSALATRTILVGASSEAVGGVLGIAIAVRYGWVADATEIFALYFSLGAIAWVLASLNYQRIERLWAPTNDT